MLSFNNSKKIFIRNDDVRGTLDTSLIDIVEICIKQEVPISLAVEPANITAEVVAWLLRIKRENPALIEIVQHGYNHSLNFDYKKYGRRTKGEFGGSIPYDLEYGKLSAGKDIMDKLFGEFWSPIITFPYGTFGSRTLKAANDLGYKGMSSSISFEAKANIKDKIGHAFSVNHILGKKVSYHLMKRPYTQLYEVDTSVNFIKSYIDKNVAIHYSEEEVLERLYSIAKHTNVIGLLLHHRYHSQYLNSFERIICELKSRDYKFSTINAIIDEQR